MRDELIRIVREAGNAIMAAKSLHFDAKADGSPVTAADRAAHEVIMRELSQISEIPIISEEGSSLPEQIPDEFWLVDPLDGTKELLKDSGEFTVNVALIRSRTPVLGVVHLPAKNVTYIGDDDGASLFGDDREATIRVTEGSFSPARICVSRDHVTDRDEEIIAKFGDCTRIPAGSALKLCLVAEGSADLYIRAGNTMEWDIAAAHAVLVGAGGSIRTIEGADLTYGKPGFLNPGFVAAANASLIDKALA